MLVLYGEYLTNHLMPNEVLEFIAGTRFTVMMALDNALGNRRVRPILGARVLE
jgi:hypothetical protein